MESKDLELARREDYLIKATIRCDDQSIADVPCKVFLPERFGTAPYLILKPERDAFEKIVHARQCSLDARFPATIGPPELAQWMTIAAPEVWVTSAQTQYWGEDLTERTIQCEPQDLHVVRAFPPSGACDGTQISFIVSQNVILDPGISPIMSYTGTVEQMRSVTVRFDLDESGSVTMDREFQHRRLKNGDMLQWSELIASLKTSVPASDSEQIKATLLPTLDDFLLVASMVARQRFVCLGWRAHDNAGMATSYRGNYTFPAATAGTGFHSWMVDPAHVHEFIQSCYTRFRSQADKMALRIALHALVPCGELMLESSFLRLFAGLEALVLAHRRGEGLEFVMAEDEWKRLRPCIEQSIKAWNSPGLTKRQRDLIYKKLPELNRVPLKDALTGFFEMHSVFVDDLWPIFRTKDLVGLADIRNRLIHGDSFPSGLIHSLGIAKLHLERVLERAVVRLLGGNIGVTKIGPAHRGEEWVQRDYFAREAARLGAIVNNEESPGGN